MSELLINKGKKEEWLQKYGTPDALELLGLQVEELNQKAIQQKILSKEINDMEVNESVGVADPLAGLTEEQPVKTSDGFDDLAGFMENKDVNQAVVEQVTEESSVIEAPEAVVKEVEEVQVDEKRELIDTLIVEIVNPMIEELKEVRKELQTVREERATEVAAREALQKQINTLQKELQDQGLQIQEEALPQASTAALLKNYIKEQLQANKVDNVVLGNSVAATDPILTKKPAENKSKGYEENGVFGGFLNGN